MKIWNGIFCIGILAMTGNTSVWAASCLENRDFYQSLPTVIGKEDQVTKLPFALNCDTVFVRKGVTTIVYPGSMLYFSKPTLNSVIKVEGTLLIKGTKNSFVSLSGSLDSTRNGFEAGNHQWGGIEVAEGGRLEIEYGGFMKAPTPITAFSKNVIILNTWFKGSSGIILPDGGLISLETKWHAINNLNLAKGKTDRSESEPNADALSAKEKDALLSKSEPGFWTWKKMAGGAAVLAVVGIGANALMTPEKSDPVKKPEPNVKKLNNTLPVFDGGLPQEE
jgi:hypothetical protein